MLVITTGTMAHRQQNQQNSRKGPNKNHVTLTDSIRDEQRGIEHTLVITWNPATNGPLPFSADKVTGPHAGKGRLEHIAGNRWRVDYVSKDSVLAAIDAGVDILSVRTERGSVQTSGPFRLCEPVMETVKTSKDWYYMSDGSYSCEGNLVCDTKEMYAVQCFVYPKKKKGRFVAEIRVCALPDAFGEEMFDYTSSIRENFLFWVRYGTKGRDGSLVDRHVTNGFCSDTNLRFVATSV